MKIIVLTILALALLSSLCDAQSTKRLPLKTKKGTETVTIFNTADSTVLKSIPDTIYKLHEKDLIRMFNLLQQGLQGVATSPDFSKNAVAYYQKEFLRMDSVFKAQVKKYHPDKTLKK